MIVTGWIDGQESYCGGLLYKNLHAHDGLHISVLELFKIRYKEQGLGKYLHKEYVEILKNAEVEKIIARALLSATGFYYKMKW